MMLPNYIKVKDHKNLVRDKRSNAILNIDDEGFNKYKQERDAILKEQKEYEKMKLDVAETKKEISEIKNLLLRLLDNK